MIWRARHLRRMQNDQSVTAPFLRWVPPMPWSTRATKQAPVGGDTLLRLPVSARDVCTRVELGHREATRRPPSRSGRCTSRCRPSLSGRTLARYPAAPHPCLAPRWLRSGRQGQRIVSPRPRRSGAVRILARPPPPPRTQRRRRPE